MPVQQDTSGFNGGGVQNLNTMNYSRAQFDQPSLSTMNKMADQSQMSTTSHYGGVSPPQSDRHSYAPSLLTTGAPGNDYNRGAQSHYNYNQGEI